MMTAVLALSAIGGAIVLLLLLVFRHDLVGVDLSGRSLLRLYLYLASLAAIIVTVGGLATLFDWGTATAFGNSAVYGRGYAEYGPPIGMQNLEHDQSLISGITFTVFGLLFWAGHRYARGRVGDEQERTSALRRAYVTLGTFVFGLAALVLVPVGVYLAISLAVLETPTNAYQQGIGGSLWGGVLSLPLWAVYLRRLVTDFRSEQAPTARPRMAPAARGA